jgi:hypothetical protein
MGQTLDPKVELGDNLSQEQHDAIRESVPDWDGDAKAPDPVPAKTPEQEAQEKAAAESQATETARLNALAAETGKTVEQIQQEETAAKDSEAKAKEAETKEQERLDKLAKDQNKTVDQIKAEETAAAEKAELARLEAIAKEENITVDEVKENEKKDQIILERHANDAKKLARAMRKEQSEYGKVKAQLDEINEAKAAQQKALDEQRFAKTIESKKDEIIEKYRENFPHDAEDQSDDVIFDRAKGLLRASFDKAIADQKAAVKTAADNRKREMVETLPQEYSDVKAEVKEMLDQCLDEQVLSKKFDVTFLANSARGKKFTPAYIKTLTDAAYKRGIEQPKILGATNLGTNKQTPRSTTQTVSLTEGEKDRAREMFSAKGWTEERMFQEYDKNHKGKDF